MFLLTQIYRSEAASLECKYAETGLHKKYDKYNKALVIQHVGRIKDQYTCAVKTDQIIIQKKISRRCTPCLTHYLSPRAGRHE